MPSLATVTDVARDIGRRCADTASLITHATREENAIPYIGAHPWDPTSPSHGYPALIFLFAALDETFPDEGWDSIAHRMLEALITELHAKGHTNCSAFSGLVGMTLSVLAASRGRTRYAGLLSDCMQLIVDRITGEYLEPIRDGLEKGKSVSPLTWDVIVGVSGVLPCLLHCTDQDNVRACCHTIVGALSELVVQQNMYEGKAVPGFYIPSHLLLHTEQRERYAPGCIDTGMAHGISGMLASLTFAALQLPSVADTARSAVGILAGWLVDAFNAKYDVKEGCWPSRLVLQENGTYASFDSFHRDGWCYGAPGIGRSLFVANTLLNDEEIGVVVDSVFASLSERLPEGTGLVCPSLCHGWAGLLATLQSMHLDTGKDEFAQMTRFTADRILSCYDVSRPFGFATLSSQLGEPEVWIDNPGLLDGVSGIVLALLAYEQGRRPLWKGLFAIEGAHNVS